MFLGWRWLPSEQKVELGFYGYLKGQRVSQALAKVDLGRWVDIEIRFHKNGLALEADGLEGPCRFDPDYVIPDIDDRMRPREPTAKGRAVQLN